MSMFVEDARSGLLQNRQVVIAPSLKSRGLGRWRDGESTGSFYFILPVFTKTYFDKLMHHLVWRAVPFILYT